MQALRMRSTTLVREAASRPLFPQPQALVHAEPVLLVHDHEGEIREAHFFLEERVGADDEARPAAGHSSLGLAPRPRRHPPG
jgi:hypothetical protein